MDIEVILRRQAGVISRAQALAAGLSSSAIGRRVVAGSWVRLYPQVFLAADHELTAEARLRGAVLWAGPGATASGVPAAWWHGLWPDPPGIMEVTLPHNRKRSPWRGVRVRRRDLERVDRVEVRGVWTTAVPLTVLESAVELGSRIVDRALQRRVTFDDLVQTHRRNLGRHGSAVVRGLLRAAGDRAASEAERVLTGLLRGAGLTGWRRGYLAGGYELDFAFPAELVAIEVDGWAWHSDVDRFRRDRVRQNALVLGGWVVLRFTWHDLIHRPEAVITEIRRALAARPAA